MLVSEYRKPDQRNRVCTVDTTYFSRLTPDTAYWLGYLLADGNVSFRKRDGIVRQFVLQAASKDKEHLEKLKTAMRSTYALCGPYRGVWQLSIPDYTLCLSVEKFGIVPNKSLTASPPKLAEALERHWARGVIDGDGSFNAYHRPNRAKKLNGKGRPATAGRVVTVLSVVGSFDVTTWFLDRFGGSLRPKANVWSWTVSGDQAKDVIAWCYSDVPSEITLDRKRLLAVKLGIVKEDNHGSRPR